MYAGRLLGRPGRTDGRDVPDLRNVGLLFLCGGVVKFSGGLLLTMAVSLVGVEVSAGHPWGGCRQLGTCASLGERRSSDFHLLDKASGWM